jgi:hypothetical protein
MFSQTFFREHIPIKATVVNKSSTVLHHLSTYVASLEHRMLFLKDSKNLFKLVNKEEIPN